MTRAGEWIHIADHAWDRHGIGCEYTIHEENNRWVARGFSVSAAGAAAIEAEEFADSMNAAKHIVEQWDSAGTCLRSQG